MNNNIFFKFSYFVYYLINVYFSYEFAINNLKPRCLSLILSGTNDIVGDNRLLRLYPRVYRAVDYPLG